MKYVDSDDKGLMLLEKNRCLTGVYQANDLIASTNNGGFNWTEAEEITTNLRINFSNSQKRVTEMLHDEFFSTYWDWKEKKKMDWKLDMIDDGKD